MTCFFLPKNLQSVYVYRDQSATPFLSGALPPKKNPGSAPETFSPLLRTWKHKLMVCLVTFSLFTAVCLLTQMQN